MLTKEERDELRCKYTDASSASKRIRMLLDTLDEMEDQLQRLADYKRMREFETRSSFNDAPFEFDAVAAMRERDEARQQFEAERARALKFELSSYHLADVATSCCQNLEEARVNLRELHDEIKGLKLERDDAREIADGLREQLRLTERYHAESMSARDEP